MTTPDHVGFDRLDDYLDRLAHDDREQPPVGLDPWLAATARAIRDQSEAPAPDPRFVARLRETLLMDASIPLPDPNPARNDVIQASSPASPFASLPSLARSADARHRGARPHLTASATLAPQPTPIAIRRRGTFAQRWNRHGWPIVELVGVAALVIGLVSVMVGGNGGLPGMVPGFGHTSQVSTPTADTGDVAMAQGNAGRTSEMPGPGVVSDPTVLWSKTLSSGAFTTAPIVAGNLLIGISQTDAPYSSQVAAYDTATGNVRWQVGVRDGSLEYGAPAVSGGIVLVPVTDYGPPEFGEPVFGTPGATPTPIQNTGSLLALDTDTGEEVWRFETGGIGYLSPLVVEDLVYVTDGIGVVQAISIETGEEVWNATVPTAGNLIPNALLSAADGLIYVATSLGSVHALAALTGDEAWTFDIGGDNPTTPVVSDGVVYIATSYLGDVIDAMNLPLDTGESIALTGSDEATPPGEPANALPKGVGRLYAITAATGEQAWSVDLDHFVRPAPTVADGMVILAGAGANGDEIVALDTATGMNELWSLTTDGNVDTSVAVVDGVGYVGTYGSTFYAIDLESGSTAWSVQTGGTIALQAFVSGGFVFMSSGGQDGTLYALGISNNATPGAASMNPTDISGLPPCDVEPRPAAPATPVPNSDGTVPTTTIPMPDATPEYTLDGTDSGEGGLYQATIAWSEIAVGPPATDEQVAGISETLQAMESCDRPGNGRYIAAFYSDDYFLRPWVIETVAYNGYQFFRALEGAVDPATIAEQARVLPDGRIAVVRTFDASPDFGQLYIFVEQDGQWLIDEFADISRDGVPGRG